MQVIKCTLWSTRLHPYPTVIKKMNMFLEVEGKMGPVPAPTSIFRPPLPNTNPNIRKDNATEKRKRVVPKRFRSAAPKPTAAHLPLPEAPPKPKNDVPDSQPVPVCESTPWPGTGKMSGNLFEDRNWLLLPNYLNNDNENKTESEPKNTASVTSPRPPVKEEELKTNDQEKCSWGPDCPFCKSRKKEEESKPQQQKISPKIQKTTGQKTQYFESKHDKSQPPMGAEMERLNSKYNLDCFSDSELDSESDEGEQYCYQHGYETLI